MQKRMQSLVKLSQQLSRLQFGSPQALALQDQINRQKIQLHQLKLHQTQASKLKELKATLLQINEKHVKDQSPPSEVKRIPAGLSLKKFRFRGNQSLVVGVQKKNLFHAAYLYEVLCDLRPSLTLTLIEPDRPYFIHTDNHFVKQWDLFLRGKSTRFITNPRPNRLVDTILNKDAITSLMNNFKKANDLFQISDHSLIEVRPEQTSLNVFTTPILFSSNIAPLKACAISMVELDLLRQVELLSRLPITQLRSLLFKKKKSKLDTVWKFVTSNFKLTRTKYLAQLLKQATLASDRSVAVLTPDDSQNIAQIWDKLEQAPQELNSILKIGSQRATLIEWIERLAIADVIAGGKVNEYYLNNHVFPFDGSATVGFEQFKLNVLQIWQFYFKVYEKKSE